MHIGHVHVVVVVVHVHVIRRRGSDPAAGRAAGLPGRDAAGQPICAAFQVRRRPRAQRAPCLHTALADSFTLPGSSQAPQAIKRSAD